MKLSVSAYRAHASAHKKILSSSYHSQLNYGSTGAAAASSSTGLYTMEPSEAVAPFSTENNRHDCNSDSDVISPTGTSSSGQEQVTEAACKYHSHDDNISNVHSSNSKSFSQRKSRIGDGASDPDSDWTRSNQRWMKLRTTVQISSAIQKKPPLKREDSFLKRFSTRQIPETQETVEDTGSESASGETEKCVKRRRRYLQKRRSVVNPDENFYFYWLMILTICVLYNMWTLIVRQSFPELQKAVPTFWFICDALTDIVFIFDILVQLRTGYLEQGLMVYNDRKLACHYIHSKDFFFDMMSLIPLDLLQLKMGTQPLLRFTRFFKVYRSVRFYYIVESRTVWPNLWRVVNLIHILLILAHWFGCFYFLLSEAEGFQGDWVYPYRPGDYATLTRKYLGSLYWSTLTLTTIGDLPTPETNAEYIFTIVSYLIGVFIFATIVGQVGNVITNRNANRLEFERLLDGAKTYMRHHKVPGGMKRRVLRWYDYSWSRGRIQGGGDINTALGLLPDKLKTELALHVNLSVLKKVTIFQECQPEFLHDLVLKMKAYIFTPGDSICRKGEVAREMFIIADGILEVLSETGKVLTTMKAGDFFGEIGILNLDGLNKRTADVRSVGYSELFSLSREDVLTAMKDYPEAQEILQTLGRKRLMEVRCVNKKYAKAQSDKEAAAFHAHVHQSDSSENSASKKIVEKLRNDVKGFRNVLKKTRTSRRSDESLEMQPLHNISPKNGKTMLKRMSRVRSDEKEKDDNTEECDEIHDKKLQSPIGAGLPLLHRLRLLKEKQDREERAVKSTPPQKSPPHTHVTSTLSPQESIQEEPERELNEGFPLIQRLQHLKIKNDVPSNEEKQLVTGPAILTQKLDAISLINSNSNNHGINTPSLTVPQIKPIMKVSFKQRMHQLQSAGSIGSSLKLSSSNNTNINKPPEESNITLMKKEILTNFPGLKINNSNELNPNSPKSIPNISNKILKPSIIKSSVIPETDIPIKPWSKLKLATLLSSSYTSLTNYSSDDIGTPIKNYSMGNIPNMMTEESVSTSSSTPVSASVSVSYSGSAPASASSMSSSTTKRSLYMTPMKFNVKRGELQSLNVNTALKSADNCGNQTKFYQSVFDLSPEYSGLPFVKRLKILNERQKLAELEKALQTRSFSLDSSKTNIGPPMTESLYRCYSDASGIYSQFLSTYESSSTTSTNTSTSENSKKNSNKNDLVHHEYIPLSPESNETLERRKLKSILKKLHNSKDQFNDPALDDDIDCAQSYSWGLPSEPTLTGPPTSAKSCSDEDNFVAFGTNIDQPELGTQTAGASNVNGINSLQQDKSIKSTDFNATNSNCSKNNNHLSKSVSISSSLHSDTHYLPKLDKQSISSSIGQIPKLEGFPEAEEYFNQILCGINNVIKTHMNEMHLKFESQFSFMACEVKRRDAIIAHLQSKLKNIEMKSSISSSVIAGNTNRAKSIRNKYSDDMEFKMEEQSSSDSSAELLFMRGDSLDTVFTSSPPIQTECSSAHPSTSKHVQECPITHLSHQTYPRHNFLTSSNVKNLQQRNERGAVIVSDVTGNLTSLEESVILDIGESSSSSSSSCKVNIDEDDDEQECNKSNKDDIETVHHNDWEVRMLAAEMEKQERKRGYSLCENLSDIKPGALLRRRRKFSDTETEHSETDVDAEAMQMPNTTALRQRASSLDQFNLKYGIGGGMFKAMSSDRDRDKL